MEKLGLSYSEIRSIKPEIVYCSISGFGATGPYSKRSGFDLVAQGMSGHMSFTGHPDSEPVKLSVPISDLKKGEKRKVTEYDFAVLCSNCHRMIHRQANPGDLEKLKSYIRK